MEINKYLLESIYVGNAELPAQIDIYCERSMRKEIMDFFRDSLEKEHANTLDAFRKEYGNCTSKRLSPMKAGVNITELGFSVYFEGLFLYYEKDGDEYRGDIDGVRSVNDALLILKEEYPDVEYEGYIAEIWADVNGGGVGQWEFSSKNFGKSYNDYKILESLGWAIGLASESKGFWNRLDECSKEMSTDEMEEVLNNFILYYEYIPKYQWVKLKSILLYYDQKHKSRYLFQIISVLNYIVGHRYIEHMMLHQALTCGYIELLMMVAHVVRNTDYEGDDSLEACYARACELAENGDEQLMFLTAKYILTNIEEKEEIEKAKNWIRILAKNNKDGAAFGFLACHREYWKSKTKMF